MLSIVLAMLLILVIAALVVVYAAFPHRGEGVPGAPWVGRMMQRTVDSVPTIDQG